MEKIIKNTITNHLIKHKLLSVHQHGFVRNKSCLTNLLETLDLMTEAINSGSTVDAVFLDLAKAFDIVPHEALIIKLKAYGINGTLLQWCISFVTGRKQRVIMGKYISEWKPVLSGIFQGSCLGPTFFIIFNNDMPDKMKHFIKLFADDTKLIAIINNLQDNLSFQLDINAASKWTSDWHMRFNEDKCKIMHIMKKRKQDQYKHSYTLNDKDLVETVSERDLGVIISNDLKWKTQCETAASKANSTLGMLKRTFSYWNLSSLKTLYTSFVRPQLEIFSSVWNPYRKKDIKKLESVQRRATKLVPSIRKLPYDIRLIRLGLTRLTDRRDRGMLIDFYKIYNNINKVRWHVPIRQPNYLTQDGPASGIRNNEHSIVMQNKINTAQREYFFSNRIVPHWNKLPKSVIEAKSVNSFKNKLDLHLFNSKTLF